MDVSTAPSLAESDTFAEAVDPAVLVDTSRIDVRQCADGLMRLQLPAGAHISEAMARDAAEQLLAETGGRLVPVLLELTGVGSVSRGARQVYTQATHAAAFALLGESPVDRVIANFFLGGQCPNCPTKFFTSESEALIWLEDYVRPE